VRKKPWELHVIVCLHLLILGAASSEQWFGTVREWHFVVIGAMAVSLVGLFRGNRFVWGILTGVFAVLSAVTAWADVSLILQYGFRMHWLFRNTHALVLLCAGTFGLLLNCRFRGAIPAPARPLWDDAPLLTRVIAVFASILFLGAGLASFSIVLLLQFRRSYGEYRWPYELKTLASAEADFRANDRDENGRNDFWTGDVQGLYALIPKGGKNPIKLIELSAALSDGDPRSSYYPPLSDPPHPRGGAWLAALAEDRSVTPAEHYHTPAEPLNRERFGFLHYPNDYIGGGRYAFIVNENNTVFRTVLKSDIRGSDRNPPGPVKDPEFLHWPSDDELKARWSKLD